jgi:uncharacterized protein (DUF433 family)
MRGVFEASLRRVDRDCAGLARHVFPWLMEPTEPRILAVCPAIAFGRPFVVGARVPAEVLFERFLAGDSDQHLADEYALAPDLIEDLLSRWFALAAA